MLTDGDELSKLERDEDGLTLNDEQQDILLNSESERRHFMDTAYTLYVLREEMANIEIIVESITQNFGSLVMSLDDNLETIDKDLEKEIKLLKQQFAAQASATKIEEPRQRNPEVEEFRMYNAVAVSYMEMMGNNLKKYEKKVSSFLEQHEETADICTQKKDKLKKPEVCTDAAEKK